MFKQGLCPELHGDICGGDQESYLSRCPDCHKRGEDRFKVNLKFCQLVAV
ncbi:hypothetical protein [Pseudomonas luteola]